VSCATRRPCCRRVRRKPPRNAGNLYRKFAPGNAMNRKSTKTIGKHGEVVEKPLYKCEGLMHVAAWCTGAPHRSSRRSGNTPLTCRLARPLRPMSHLRFRRASLTRDFDAHRIEQRSIPRTSRATVRRAMTQRATRPVTLVTLTSDPLSQVKVARLCRRCDIGLMQ